MADSPDPSGIPEARDGDDDDVSWALQTAAVQLKRGTMAEALPWLKRAVDAANAAGDAFRAAELAEAVQRLEAEVVPIDDEVEVAIESLPPPSEEPAPLSEEALELDPESIPPSRPATAAEVAVPPPPPAPAVTRPPPPSALRPGPPPRPSTGPPRPSAGPPRPPSAARPPVSARLPVAAAPPPPAPPPPPPAPSAPPPPVEASPAPPAESPLPPPTLAAPTGGGAPARTPASPSVASSPVGALIAEAVQSAGVALDDDLASLPPALRPPTPLPPPEVRARLRASMVDMPRVVPPAADAAPDSEPLPAMSEPPPSGPPPAVTSQPPPKSLPPPAPVPPPFVAEVAAVPPSSLVAPASHGPPPSLTDELAAELAAEFDALDEAPRSDEAATAELPVDGDASALIYEPPPAPPPEPEPEPDAPGFVGGIALAEVPGLEDLPEEAHAELSAGAEVHRLEANEELGGFGVALVLAGNVAIMPSVADLPCARASRGEVIFTSGNLADGVALRVVATMNRTRVATWGSEALVAATSECPWVADDLRSVADRFQALAGATMGAFGERMDETLFRQVVDRCAVKRLLPGEVLFEAGHEVDAMVVVGAGRLELVEGEAVSDELGPGDLVYTAQLMAHGKSPCTVRAGTSGALLLHAERKAAHELMMSVPPLLEILVG